MTIDTQITFIALSLLGTGCSLALAGLRLQAYVQERKIMKQKRQADHLAVLRFIEELRGS